MSSASDAALGGLHFDSGEGYNTSRHGTSVGVATIQEIIDACRPYGMSFQLECKPTTTGAGTSLAQLVVDNGFEERVYIHCYSDALAAEIKAVSSRILVGRDSADSGDSNTDIFSIAYASVASLSTITAYAPLIPSSNMPADEYGDPEETIIQNMYDRGVRCWTTNDLDAALAKRASIYATEGIYFEGVTDHGALTGLADDDHTQYLNETRHDLLDHAGLTGVAGRIITVDPGTPTVADSGDDLVVSIASVWGYDGDGPYYDWVA